MKDYEAEIVPGMIKLCPDVYSLVTRIARADFTMSEENWNLIKRDATGIIKDVYGNEENK